MLFFSSVKTLAMATAPTRPFAGVNVQGVPLLCPIFQAMADLVIAEARAGGEVKVESLL